MSKPLLKTFPIFLIAVFATSPLLAGRMGRVDNSTLETPRYTVEDDAFVGHNGDGYCNRPLYCNHIDAVAFGGDKPYAMVGSKKIILGNLMFALLRDGKGQWLQNASDITAKYRPGRMEWIVKDAAWGDTIVHIEVVPTADGPGLAAHAWVDHPQPNDQLLWASGGAHPESEGVLKHWDMTVPSGSSLIRRGFVPSDCTNNSVEATGNSWTLHETPKATTTTRGQCSADAKITIADASAWKDPQAFLASSAKSLPIACAAIPLAQNKEIFWSLRGAGGDPDSTLAPADEFAAGMKRVHAIQDAVTVDTPDPWLNAAVGASTSVIDGVFRNGVYTHAGMRWGVPLLGWRTTFGGTVYGAHDNVKTEAKLAIAKQVTDSTRTEAKPDPAMDLSSQAPDSRLFGKGRIDFHQPYHYDMQTQFFDQVQHAWRWTSDDDLQKLLRPSLDLHCEYIQQCFDPAKLGIYESYANTWPTDDQWYNGGGTAEETAYAYRAEKTALLLAQRAHDSDAQKLHEANLARIKKGFFDLLWIQSLGHAGAYREQGGLKRLHECPWLYGIFCPIDAGILTTEQAAESLLYTETELERDSMPFGGQQCWPSNWVPSIWSVREMWPGDNYQLALSYFQTGLPDDGYTILHGTFPMCMFFGPVPADLGHPAGATDFNDCASMFARTVVEGLFGYTPDYPNGLVTIAPEFPPVWNHASIKTPDMSIAFHRAETKSDYKVMLTKPCTLELRLPVATSAVQSVMVDGVAAKWELIPGFGRTLVKVTLPNVSSADVEITTQDALAMSPSDQLSGNTGDRITLAPPDKNTTTIIDFHDPQSVLQNASITDGTLTGTLTANAGDHSVFALQKHGQTQQWHIYKIHVTDVEHDQNLAAKTTTPVTLSESFQPIDIRPALNGDIRTIYQQKYLSPRPNTVSLRLATDGYSTWQMALVKNHRPPEISLANVNASLNPAGELLTKQDVPFLWPSGKNNTGKNIAFTSQWDNWPKHIDIPIHKTADAIWFLLCGTTNSMEVRIPNAVLHMKYADGIEENLELIPPFNFWTLCNFGGTDYDYYRDGFALPKNPPPMVQLGNNCRAMLLNWNLRPGVELQSVTLENLSQQSITGLMGVTIMTKKSAG